jgi:uncharacterized protein
MTLTTPTDGEGVVATIEPMTDADEAAITAQLGRPPRGVVGVAWRCPCGKAGVVATAPRLPGGTPFPTTYYLTCPRATSACSTLEASGLMAEMTERLGRDPDLADRYRRAHQAYLADRTALGDVPEIVGVSAGGMPDRVKCLHALLGQALAAGSGVNPFGDETRDAIGEFWQRPCLPETPPEETQPEEPHPEESHPDETPVDVS